MYLCLKKIDPFSNARVVCPDLSVLVGDGALQTASQIRDQYYDRFVEWGSQALGCLECVCGVRDRV